MNRSIALKISALRPLTLAFFPHLETQGQIAGVYASSVSCGLDAQAISDFYLTENRGITAGEELFFWSRELKPLLASFVATTQ